MKSFINSKVTELKNSKFPDKGWSVNGLNYLLKKLRDTGTTARQTGSGRRQSARITHSHGSARVVLALDLEGVHDVKLHHPSSSVATSNQ